MDIQQTILTSWTDLERIELGSPLKQLVSVGQRTAVSKTWFGLILASLILACADDTGTGPPSTISASAEAYLSRALDTMQTHSVNRYTIDWPSFRDQTFVFAGTAQTTADTYDAIRSALEGLGDNHSFFLPPGGQGGGDGPVPPLPSASLVGVDIGYVSVPWFAGSTQAANNLAALYHRLIEGVDTLGVCGWVVDLRGNLGGNTWPMIAGVGPIVGEGVLGSFIDPDSVMVRWWYTGGASQLEGYGVMTRVTDPYELLAPYPAVAVLTDSLVASSGESTAIAFRGRPSTRSFGQPTWGVSTANQGFGLSDGAVLWLTIATMADRTGRLYGARIFPDQEVPTEYPPSGNPATDQPLAAGMQWLQSQPACAGSPLSTSHTH